MTILKFTKMHGLGNDFVIFDQRSDDYSGILPQVLQQGTMIKVRVKTLVII